MLAKRLFVLLALVALAESMGRPIVRRPHYEDCSCEDHDYSPEDSVPCDDSEETTTPEDEETTTTTAAPTSTTTTPTTTRTSTVTTTTNTPTTTTTIRTTTAGPGCPRGVESMPFLRKNGYWCAAGVFWSVVSVEVNPMTRSYAEEGCQSQGMVLSSLETDEEWAYWYSATNSLDYNVTGVWIGASQDTGTNQYYWDDGVAIREMNPQPVQNVTDGYAVYYPNKDQSTPGYGYVGTADASGELPGVVNMAICGTPGRQFS